LPTLVSFSPVLASLVTSGKYWVTTLTGTTVLRGSNAADVAVVVDDESSLHAANERSAIAATESSGRPEQARINFVARGQSQTLGWQWHNIF
jgi:hypothetical protein